MNSKHNMKFALVFGISALLLLGQTSLTAGYRNYFGPFYSPFVWMLSGMGMCLLAWGYLFVRRETEPFAMGKRHPLERELPMLILLIGSLFAGFELAEILPKYPIDPQNSDIIPALKLYVTRFLAGEKVYAPMDFGSWTVIPNYLPLRWLVFVPAEWLGMDYRWWSFLVFIGSLIPWYIKISRSETSLAIRSVMSALPMVVLLLLLVGDEVFFGMTVELMFVALYLWLGWALTRKSPVFLGVAVLFCLLSRFSFSFWLPAFFLAYWIQQGWKKTLLATGIIGSGVVLIYIIPYLSKDWSQFSDGMAYYRSAALDHWRPEFWQQPDELPFYVGNGLSFTYHFYSLPEGELAEKLAWAQDCLKYGGLLTALLLFAGYWWVPLFRKHWLLFWWIALIFYLYVFYSFMYLPFPYLFMLPILLFSVAFVPFLGGSQEVSGGS
jgi:hypothetical protein